MAESREAAGESGAAVIARWRERGLALLARAWPDPDDRILQDNVAQISNFATQLEAYSVIYPAVRERAPSRRSNGPATASGGQSFTYSIT